MQVFILLIRLSRPLFLLGVALLYALGGGIANYLGVQIDWGVYLLGQLWVTLLQLSTHYLNEYYNAPGDRQNPNRTFLTGGSGVVGPGKLDPQVPLILALTCLAALASSTVLLITQVRPSPGAYLIMGLAFLGAFFYSTPPVKLEASGYGELTTSVMIAFLVPAYAYILQAGELHRLVAMSTFPLALLHLAMLMAFELPDYAADARYEKRTLMIRLGWQNGVVFHNVMILSAYLLLVLAASFGYPWFAVWPVLLTMPLGLFQIWQMRGIAAGARPNWTALTAVALALFAVSAYLTAIVFWMN